MLSVGFCTSLLCFSGGCSCNLYTGRHSKPAPHLTTKYYHISWYILINFLPYMCSQNLTTKQDSFVSPGTISDVCKRLCSSQAHAHNLMNDVTRLISGVTEKDHNVRTYDIHTTQPWLQFDKHVIWSLQFGCSNFKANFLHILHAYVWNMQIYDADFKGHHHWLHSSNVMQQFSSLAFQLLYMWVDLRKGDTLVQTSILRYWYALKL